VKQAALGRATFPKAATAAVAAFGKVFGLDIKKKLWYYWA
jgi:hypothetical protein